MKVELNIGLDLRGLIDIHPSREHLAKVAIHALAPFPLVAGRHVSSYVGPHGRATEHLLFVALEANNLFDVLQIVYNLAGLLQQDCIAVYLPETHEGALVGSGAAKWGDFNRAYFVRGAINTERLAA